MRRIVIALLLMFGSILVTAAMVLPMTIAHDGATGNLTGAGQAYYALTDHLGSYTRLYTMAGDSVLIASYDPWGNRTTTKNTLKFHRGFTGHEHLTTYGVINMNGRMYDPLFGRFLAPDNFVQMPDFSQSFNRYSYCLNNPLKYTDPSGESIIGFLTVAMMAYVGGLQANFGNVEGNPFNPGNWDWKSLRTYIGIAQGALSGGSMVGYKWAGWTSKLDVPGIFTNGAIHAAGEVAFNGICNVIDKRGYFDGWQYSALFGFIDGAAGGYSASKENGENFWWGGKVSDGKSPWSLNPNGPFTVKFKNVRSFPSIGENDCVPQTLAEDYYAIFGNSNKMPRDFAEEIGYSSERGTAISKDFFERHLGEGLVYATENTDILFNELFIKEVAKRNNVINILASRKWKHGSY